MSDPVRLRLKVPGPAVRSLLPFFIPFLVVDMIV